MRNLFLFILVATMASVLSSPANAQATRPSADQPKNYADSMIVTRMMAFDKKGDGKLTRDEITDPRLLRLFDQADTNKDGVVTRDQLIALAAKLDAEYPADPRRNGGPDGPGPNGPGGPRGGRPGMRPQPGQVLPPVLQDMLKLTPEQKAAVADLQKEVDAKLAAILTPEQLKQMQSIGSAPPGGRRGGPPGDMPR